MDKVDSNYKLLDCKGEWFKASDKEYVTNHSDKVMVGFLADSKYNVFGFMRNGGLVGYYCTHYRELTTTEVYELCSYTQ